MMSRLLLIFTILVTFITTPAAQAQPPAGPRWALNRCGAGDSVQYTLAVAGAITPDALLPGGIETPSYAESFAPLRPFLAAADLGLATLAGPLAGGPAPALAAALAESNLLLLGAAHPRLLDRGPAGVDATLQTLARYGIYQHGAAPGGETLPPFLKVTVPHPASPLTLGFLSATWGLGGNADPRGQINLLADAAGVLPAISSAIEQARRQTDLVVVMAAWGQPNDPDPAQARINAARNLIAAGADVVIGSIPGVTATVDWVRAGDREGLAIFSAGDLIGAAETPAVLMYVGVTRDADGAARVTGIRYLPITPGNGNRGPAPLPVAPRDLSALMGDPGQLQVIAPLPPTSKIEVCPPLFLPEAPETPITGDFARFYQTFGSDQRRDLLEAIALLGLPLGPVRRELAGDCRQEVAVLYTERQRLELHPANDWPNRVLGSHLGTVAFRLAYPDQAVTPRTDLNDPAAFAHPRFRAFYERYGGLSVFGYPISGALTERDPLSGRDLVVQYFERARFELDPVAPLPEQPIWQVRLGLLGREVGAQATSVLCPATVAPNATAPSAIATPTAPATSRNVAQSSSGGAEWMMPVIIVLGLAAVGLLLYMMYDFYRYIEQHPVASSRSSRSGYRSASPPPATEGAPAAAAEPWQNWLRNFSRRNKPTAAPPAEAIDDEQPTTSSGRSLLRLGDKPGNRERATRSGPAWRQPTRTASRQTQPSSAVTSQPTTSANVRQTDQWPAAADRPANRSHSAPGQPPHQPDPLGNNELDAWFDAPASVLRNGYEPARLEPVIDQPVDWNDLPPAERERWQMELGPLDDDTAADLPPAERERWQAELAAPEPEFDPDWHRAEPPDQPRATRRLDETELPADPTLGQRTGNDDDLLRKLLGL
ncbi:capsule biosynthesis protein [Chloroflexus islandicus]|uniref:Capsule biosynthesis protein n=1 Tax=Chloroflexus islandicus TaxID=1707952 RepID=A0A178MDK4_9CHLR|nr:CapA family protein [Chloroflexus islandicus]OAN46108.1 capsule biosynthesis protein [Chloroflexus islandicus]